MRSGTVRNRSCGPGGATRTLRTAGPSSLPSAAVVLDGIVPSQLGSISNRVFFDSGGIGRSVLGYYWGVRLGQVGVPSPPQLEECPQ
jgi:hypothetical protein